MPPKMYTAEEVDLLVAKFEKCAERQEANKESVVKLRASERDLLAVAESARDLLSAAVKGDKELLAQVFGGSCLRFHRFRHVLDTVQLSEMHAKDQRWSHLEEEMQIIEEVLKQLGLFKPWQIGTKAPESLSYKGVGSKRRFSPGETVNLQPEVAGGFATSFTVSPNLPHNLTLDSRSGEISGLLDPGNEIPETTYVVTASNSAGETRVELTFSVAPPPPSALAYAGVPASCFTGEVITWLAKVSGGPVKKWIVTPKLPGGLELDQSSGAIAGTPKTPTPETEFTVLAQNSSGEAMVKLKFAVIVAPPRSLAYPGIQSFYSQGAVVYLIPEIKFKTSFAPSPRKPTAWNLVRKAILKKPSLLQLLELPDVSFTVEPALPVGIWLHQKTGVITGKTESASDEISYSVTATNAGGSASVEVRFGIKLVPPTGLLYPDVSNVYFTGQPVSLSPTVGGTVKEYWVEPSVPEGLHLDATLGIISGIPRTIAPETQYWVSCSNPEGETYVELKFAVQRAAPSNLSYPEVLSSIPVLRDVLLHPKVEGEVQEFWVEPDFPAGLWLDASSGEISGNPTAPASLTKYVVTASNETGTCTCELVLSVDVLPATALNYPHIDDVYSVGEDVQLEPVIEGGATSWTVEPSFPHGIVLDLSTGIISGRPTKPATESSYVVTASNEAGGISALLTFAVTAPPPNGLRYPDVSEDYEVEQEMLLEPVLESAVCATFEVSPSLPTGVTIDAVSGIISGKPKAETPFQTYIVTASNVSGRTEAEIAFSCSLKKEEVLDVDESFAAKIEQITDLAQMIPEPPKSMCLGDWMVWMVHRAWLNDPSLTDFNFNNLMMPMPHLEPRIAPKLMQAMARNTHIVSLQLSHSNLQKPQGHELAESMRTNTTLRNLNIESNSLDSDAMKSIIMALHDNADNALEQLRFNNQIVVGSYFGRPVEEALATLLEQNMKIVKLGVSLHDPHWRMLVDRSILRNNDFERRRRKGSTLTGSSPTVETAIVAQDKPISRILLTVAPSKAVWEIFDDNNEQLSLLRAFIVNQKRLPTNQQLQSFASSCKKPLGYSAVAPLQKDFRAKLFGAVLELEMTFTDTYGAGFEGYLRQWGEKNDRWTMDVWSKGEASARYNCISDKQPVVEVSESFSDWLKVSSD